jgi:hypothetical protein
VRIDVEKPTQAQFFPLYVPQTDIDLLTLHTKKLPNLPMPPFSLNRSVSPISVGFVYIYIYIYISLFTYLKENHAQNTFITIHSSITFYCTCFGKSSYQET